MDVKVITQVVSSAVSGHYVVSSIKPQVSSNTQSSISSQAMQFVETTSINTKLSSAEKQSMIEIASMIDKSGVISSLKQGMFKNLAGFGIMLSDSVLNTDFPKWSVLTGLRFYGGQTFEILGSDQNQSVEAVKVINVAMENAAQKFRNKSMQQIEVEVAKMPKKELAQRVSRSIGHVVEKVNDGVGTENSVAGYTTNKTV